MDLLSQRYASPFLILDDFIRLHQLHNFVTEIMNTIAKEKIEEKRWEYYLHKVWGNVTFEDYVNACENMQKQNQEMSCEQIGDVINESKKMLEGFIPSC